MQLVPNLPKEGFPKLKNLKLYVDALPKSLLDILDMDKFNQLPVEIVRNDLGNNKNPFVYLLNKYHAYRLEHTNRITFFRHEDSKYNEYKENIVTDENYQEFMTTTNINRKDELMEVLMKDFFATVGVDYKTGLSDKGHLKGERDSKLYAELIQKDPNLFPDLIYVSPYFRTRLTAHYLLKNVQGLDMDFEKLIDQSKLEDLIVGSFRGKDIAIKMDERIREKDQGFNVAPSFIRDFIRDKHSFMHLLNKADIEMINYFTSPLGGESQPHTNARKKEFIRSAAEKKQYKNILCVEHHLDILGGVQSITGGSFETFNKLNELRRPANGSMTIFSKIPKTKAGQENQFRIAGYNLSLQE